MQSKEKLVESHIVETKKHIDNVKKRVKEFCTTLGKMAASHDESKLMPGEIELFAEYTPRLKDLAYGSDEYKQCLKELGPALESHYECNAHHPEYFEDGIAGMTLMDLAEMFCDWKAATERHKDGDLERSIEINTKRFGISPQLRAILRNTMVYLDW